MGTAVRKQITQKVEKVVCFFTAVIPRFVKPFTCIIVRDTLFSPFNHLDYLLSLGLIFRNPIIIGNSDGFSIIRQVCVQNSGDNLMVVVKG